MDTYWSELQTHGIEVEESELPEDEFRRLFSGEPTPEPVNS
jgi:hypothetical protein